MDGYESTKLTDGWTGEAPAPPRPPPERAFGDTDGYVAGVRLWGGTFKRPAP